MYIYISMYIYIYIYYRDIIGQCLANFVHPEDVPTLLGLAGGAQGGYGKVCVILCSRQSLADVCVRASANARMRAFMCVCVCVCV